MNMWIQRFAQKGLVYKDECLLMIKFKSGKYLNDLLTDRWALPGGKMEQGESLDSSLIEEIRSETSILVKPGMPIDIWTWEYQKDVDVVQINTVSRLCQYVGGSLSGEKVETETVISECQWVPLNECLALKLVEDTRPTIEKFIKNKDFFLN